MRTRRIASGDLVMVNRKGRIFYAKVTRLEQAGHVQIEPIDKRISYRSITAREIVEHWTHVRADDDTDGPGADQLSLDGFDE